MKTCGRCKGEFPATNEYFYRRHGTSDGLTAVCKTCRNSVRDNHRKNHLPEYAARQRKYRTSLSDEQREIMRERTRNWYAQYGEKQRTRMKSRLASLRLEMVAAYGGKCACCGETNPRFLTIDHVNGRGTEHRKNAGGAGSSVIFDLHRRGWPKSGYQLLCYNCNCGRALNNGVCPHVTSGAAVIALMCEAA